MAMVTSTLIQDDFLSIGLTSFHWNGPQVVAAACEPLAPSSGPIGSLLLTFPRVALGADFSQFEEGGATNIGNLRAMSDEEMGKISPSPKGCGENPAILRCRPR
jgi:hypothetical protein